MIRSEKRQNEYDDLVTWHMWSFKYEEIVVAMGDAHVIFHKKNRNFRYIWLYHHSAVERDW